MAEDKQDKQDEQERIGSMAGMGAGMLTGAKIGARALPIPGLGTFAGAVVGGVVGTEIGKRLGKAVYNGVEAFAKTLTQGGNDKA